MKKFIQNLFMPFAVVAMLSVGAFTVNASNTTDVTVVNEDVIDQQEVYEGPVYYHDSLTPVLFSNTSDGSCTLEVTAIAYVEKIAGIDRQMYGLNPSTGNPDAPLYKRTN